MPGLAGSGSVVPVRIEAKEFEKGQDEPRGVIIIWGGPRKAHGSTGYRDARIQVFVREAKVPGWAHWGKGLGHP